MRTIKKVGELPIDLLPDDFLIQPNQPVANGEKVIGEVNAKARSAYIEAVRVQSEAQHLKDILRRLDNSRNAKEDARRERVEQRLYRTQLLLNQKVATLLLEVSKDYPDIRQIRYAALRKGWMLVSLPESGEVSKSRSFEIPPTRELFIQA